MATIHEEKDYPKVDGVEYDINKRWEEGIEHHPKSMTLMEKLKNVDYVFGGDLFYWKTGGDGDNGEHLMYELDIIFEEEDRKKDKC